MVQAAKQDEDVPIWRPTRINLKIHLLAIEPGVKEIQELVGLIENKPCRVGQAEGPLGTIRRVYKRLYRYGTMARCKVELQTGTTRYFDVLDVFCF